MDLPIFINTFDPGICKASLMSIPVAGIMCKGSFIVVKPIFNSEAEAQKLVTPGITSTS